MKRGKHSHAKKSSARLALSLPDLDQARSAVLNSLPSKESQRGYRHALDEFIAWYCSEPRLSFHKAVVTRYRIHLESHARGCFWRTPAQALASGRKFLAWTILNICKLYVESPLICAAGVTGADLKRRIEAIMANRIGHGLNRAKKLLLGSAGAAAVAGPILTGVSYAPAVRA